MEKGQLRKNKLDLEYNKYIQMLNGIFIFGTTGLLGFIGSFVWSNSSNKLLVGTSASVLVIIVSALFYKKINYKLDKISDQILGLEER